MMKIGLFVLSRTWLIRCSPLTGIIGLRRVGKEGLQKNLSTSLFSSSLLNQRRIGSLSSSSSGDCLDISGIFPPIPTPFNEKRDAIHYGHLKMNFAVWNEIPFKGYVVLGSNGEPVVLSKNEKLEMVKAARAMSKPNSIIIAGLGCYGTEETIELCQEVGEMKTADAALIITPSYFKGQMTESALGAHFEAVANESPLPLILYSVPANTNIDLSPSLVRALAYHPNIIGLKDSGGDITKISSIAYETQGLGKKFQILAGSAGFLLPALHMGCVGGICALANVLGREVCHLFELFKEKKYDAAVHLQQQLILPNSMVTRTLGVPGLKFSMDMAGLFGGRCRAPLLPLKAVEIKELKDVFARCQDLDK